MKTFIFSLFAIASFAHAAPGFQVKNTDGQMFITEKTLEDLYVFSSEVRGFEAVCFYGTQDSALKVLAKLIKNSGIVDKKGKLIPSFDENDIELPAHLSYGKIKKNVFINVTYNYPDEIGHDFSLEILPCKP